MTGYVAHEFRMQVRKPSLWITTAVLAVVLVALQGDRGPFYLPADTPARVVMANWAFLFNLLLPIGFGMVLADRLVRDRRLKVAPLLDSLPTGVAARLTGRYAGSVAATALPGLAALLVAAAGTFAVRHDPAVLGWALASFALVTLPAVLFVGAFAITVPVLISAPLFRVLFVGYWFWGNMLGPAILPSFSGTLLTPIGDYPASWLTGERALHAGADGWLLFLRPDVGPGATVGSLVLLAAVAVLPLAAAVPLLNRRTA